MLLALPGGISASQIGKLNFSESNIQVCLRLSIGGLKKLAYLVKKREKKAQGLTLLIARTNIKEKKLLDSFERQCGA